jgi:hypothetical protein
LAGSLGLSFIEASAKTAENVDEAFNLLTKQLISQKKGDTRGTSKTIADGSISKLDVGNSKKGSKSCC